MAHVRMYEGRAIIQSGLIAARHQRKVLDYMHDVAVRAAAGGPYSTGRLASSLMKSGPLFTGLTVTSHVYSNLPYADIVEKGAKVHNIFPRGASGIWRFGSRRRPQLKFIWRGRTVFTPHVPMSPRKIGISHPGSKGKHYMLKAITRTAIRYRLKLRIWGE